MFALALLLPLIVFACVVDTIIGMPDERARKKRLKSRHRPLVRKVLRNEELPELAPVAASVAPEVEPVVAVPVVESAPAPVVDPMAGWSKPVIDEVALSTPAYIRRAGITPYAAYRRLNPLKVPVVLLRARKPELDSEPVFDFGERLPVGFDGAPVH